MDLTPWLILVAIAFLLIFRASVFASGISTTTTRVGGKLKLPTVPSINWKTVGWAIAGAVALALVYFDEDGVINNAYASAVAFLQAYPATLIIIALAALMFWKSETFRNAIGSVSFWLMAAFLVLMAGLFVFYPVVTGKPWHSAKVEYERTGGNTTSFKNVEVAGVGVWSKEMPVEIGCKVDYARGHGVWYDVMYKDYNQPWRFQEPGTRPNSRSIKFRITSPGESSVPVKVTC